MQQAVAAPGQAVAAPGQVVAAPGQVVAARAQWASGISPRAVDINPMYVHSNGESIGDIAHNYWIEYHRYSRYENDFNEVRRNMQIDLDELFICRTGETNEDWEKMHQILKDCVWQIISTCVIKREYDEVAQEIQRWVDEDPEKYGEKYDFIINHAHSLLRFVHNRKTGAPYRRHPR